MIVGQAPINAKVEYLPREETGVSMALDCCSHASFDSVPMPLLIAAPWLLPPWGMYLFVEITASDHSKMEGGGWISR